MTKRGKVDLRGVYERRPTALVGWEELQAALSVTRSAIRARVYAGTLPPADGHVRHVGGVRRGAAPSYWLVSGLPMDVQQKLALYRAERGQS